MRCIKHSMMFEAQMTAISQYSMFPEGGEKKGTSKEKEEAEGTSLDSECGETVTQKKPPTVSKHVKSQPAYVFFSYQVKIMFMSNSEVIFPALSR